MGSYGYTSKLPSTPVGRETGTARWALWMAIKRSFNPERLGSRTFWAGYDRWAEPADRPRTSNAGTSRGRMNSEIAHELISMKRSQIDHHDNTTNIPKAGTTLNATDCGTSVRGCRATIRRSGWQRFTPDGPAMAPSSTVPAANRDEIKNQNNPKAKNASSITNAYDWWNRKMSHQTAANQLSVRDGRDEAHDAIDCRYQSLHETDRRELCEENHGIKWPK